MCNWHKYAIREAATDPKTGAFDVAKYALGLTLIASQRIEQDRWHISALYETDGFNPAELVTDKAQAAFAASGLTEPLEDAKAALTRDIDALRDLLTLCADACDLTPAGLNIPHPCHITKAGYKKTCCAEPDPRDNGPFLNTAVVYLYQGYDDAARKYASGDLALIGAEDLAALQGDTALPAESRKFFPLLEGLRAAAEYALERPGTRDLLQDTFRHSIAYLFLTAPADVAAQKGLSGPSHCAMCQGINLTPPQPGQ